MARPGNGGGDKNCLYSGLNYTSRPHPCLEEGGGWWSGDQVTAGTKSARKELFLTPLVKIERLGREMCELKACVMIPHCCSSSTLLVYSPAATPQVARWQILILPKLNSARARHRRLTRTSTRSMTAQDGGCNCHLHLTLFKLNTVYR